MGIQGVRIRSELRSLVKELPGTFLEVGQRLQSKSVSEATQYYIQFLASTSTATGSAAELLPTLTAVCEADLAADLAAAQSQPDTAEAAAVAANKEAGSQETTSPSQDAGSEGAGQQSSTDGLGEISWDIDLSAVGDATPDDAGPSAAIDWDIDVSEAAEAADHGEGTPQVNGSGLVCDTSSAQSGPGAGPTLCWQAHCVIRQRDFL